MRHTRAVERCDGDSLPRFIEREFRESDVWCADAGLRSPDGLVLVTLKGEWHEGTTHLLFTPVDLLEKLTALTPRARINLVI